jgi:hypothetical protein
MSAVSAWEDLDENRLKMAQRRDQATHDPEQLRLRCVGRPGAIALLTVGFVVVDLDRKNGVDGVEWWRRTIGPLPHPRTVVRTPRNGLHIWVTLPHRKRVTTRTGTLAGGVDILGTQAVVPVPGSRTSLGEYAAHDEFAFLRAPEKLLTLIPPEDDTPVVFSRSTGSSAVERFAQGVRHAPPGSNKMAALNRAAFMAGLKPNRIPVEDLGPLVEAAIQRGIREATAWSTVMSGYAAGQKATPRGSR